VGSHVFDKDKSRGPYIESMYYEVQNDNDLPGPHYELFEGIMMNVWGDSGEND
jgi:hypothetical protein